MTLLVVDFESGDRFGLLLDETTPRIEIVLVGSPRVRKGEWVHGWFRGSTHHFLAVYWVRESMWIATRSERRELDPTHDLQTIQWRPRGPFAELSVLQQRRRVMHYRYRRTVTQVLERKQYPDHDLPRWLADGWARDRSYYAAKARVGGLMKADWSGAPSQ